METEHNFTRTKAEERMARALIKERVHFEQNYLLEGYEVDFWIKEAGLVIEVDGFSHLSNRKSTSDQAKDRKLQDKGYTVIRFDNRQVDYSLVDCVKEIKSIILKIKSYHPKVDGSFNSDWKDTLKPMKKRLNSLETKEKKQQDIESYFLSLD